MSDNIPLEVQIEIIKRVSNVKSLIRFRSVSKQWKTFIDSSEFIASYGVRHPHPHRLHLFYIDGFFVEKYTCFVDDGDTFSQQQQHFATIVSDLMKQLKDPTVIGTSRGLLCLHGRKDSGKEKLVLLNPCIRKSVVIVVPFYPYISTFGFGICPITNDPTIFMISYPKNFFTKNLDIVPWKVEVFTLSSGVWNMLPHSNLPCGSIRLDTSQVIIGRFIYWVASSMIVDMGDDYRDSFMIMSFDLVAKEFRVIDMPASLKNQLCDVFYISKLRESLVLLAYNSEAVIPVCGVWKMEHDSSFTKLFAINTHDCTITNILGFRKNGELIIETLKKYEQFAELEAYEQCSERINNLGIYGKDRSFYMSSYKETLLLLDHSDCCVYPDVN